MRHLDFENIVVVKIVKIREDNYLIDFKLINVAHCPLSV